jgi:hypothetical protein
VQIGSVAPRNLAVDDLIFQRFTARRTANFRALLLTRPPLIRGVDFAAVITSCSHGGFVPVLKVDETA